MQNRPSMAIRQVVLGVLPLMLILGTPAAAQSLKYHYCWARLPSSGTVILTDVFRGEGGFSVEREYYRAFRKHVETNWEELSRFPGEDGCETRGYFGSAEDVWSDIDSTNWGGPIKLIDWSPDGVKVFKRGSEPAADAPIRWVTATWMCHIAGKWSIPGSAYDKRTHGNGVLRITPLVKVAFEIRKDTEAIGGPISEHDYREKVGISFGASLENITQPPPIPEQYRMCGPTTSAERRNVIDTWTRRGYKVSEPLRPQVMNLFRGLRPEIIER